MRGFSLQVECFGGYKNTTRRTISITSYGGEDCFRNSRAELAQN